MLIDAVIQKKQPNDVSPESVSLAFEQTLNLIEAMNSAAEDGSSASVATAIRAMQVPLFDDIDSLSCGHVPLYVTLCGGQVGLM